MEEGVIAACMEGFGAGIAAGCVVRVCGYVYAGGVGGVFVGCGTPMSGVGAVVENEGPEEGGEDYYYGVGHDF